MTQLPLILIVGPTAVGKTELAIQLAEHLNGEIVSADSRLFYRGMNIGTAKPTREEMSRVPHHLIDIADPDEILSLAVFQQKATEIISDIHTRNKLPFLVGGTGQYIRAVTQGWSPPEVEPHERLRNELEKKKDEKGIYWLHERLKFLDPIGYRECVRVLNGELNEEQAKAEIRRATRVFVRRQANWFKESDPNIQWFQVKEGIVEEIESYIHNSLNNVAGDGD